MNITEFPSHCGSMVFHQLWDAYPCSPGHDWPQDGINTIFSIFINDYRQKKTYKKLSKRYKILYQSPILVNPSTTREYFIVIFLNEKP